MNDLRRSVLIVDDEYLIAECLRIIITSMGIEVCGTASTVASAVNLAQQHHPSLVLMDVRLRGDGDGVDAAVAIHKSVGSEVIFITGSREPTTIERIKSNYPTAILFKPFSERQLQVAVESAMRAKH